MDSGHLTDVALIGGRTLWCSDGGNNNVCSHFAQECSVTVYVSAGDWIAKCKTILDKVGRSLGQNKNIFWIPVNAKVLPDYYVIIKVSVTLLVLCSSCFWYLAECL